MSSLQLVARKAWRQVPLWARRRIRGIPWVRKGLHQLAFFGSGSYWETRYASGGSSGAGSYGRCAVFKAEFLNGLVEQNRLESVVELGCGDGHQLTLARYPRYLGLDVSARAVELCRERFNGDSSKAFSIHDATVDAPRLQVADVALSLDVVYHLVEDDVYAAYMKHLFAAAKRVVVVYSSNDERSRQVPHVRHRRFTDWVRLNQPEWQLTAHVPNRYPLDTADGGETSFADFFVFSRVGAELLVPP